MTMVELYDECENEILVQDPAENDIICVTASTAARASRAPAAVCR